MRDVKHEMEYFRLYTVAPRLVRFIENLTNIYVRLNRPRLKGRGGEHDQVIAFDVLFDWLTLRRRLSRIANQQKLVFVLASMPHCAHCIAFSSRFAN